MEPTDFQSLMTSSADEVLNSMFFVGVESNGDESAIDDEWMGARVAFSGPRSGAFGIGAPLPTAKMLAANFLGQDESEIQDTQMEEVFCELSNMICGAFLSRLGNESVGHEVYDLSHPVRDAAVSPDEDGVVCRWLQLDEGQLRVWLRMEPLP